MTLVSLPEAGSRPPGSSICHMHLRERQMEGSQWKVLSKLCGPDHVVRTEDHVSLFPGTLVSRRILIKVKETCKTKMKKISTVQCLRNLELTKVEHEFLAIPWKGLLKLTLLKVHTLLSESTYILLSELSQDMQHHPTPNPSPNEP